MKRKKQKKIKRLLQQSYYIRKRNLVREIDVLESVTPWIQINGDHIMIADDKYHIMIRRDEDELSHY